MPCTDIPAKLLDVAIMDFAFSDLWKARYPNADLQLFMDLEKIFPENGTKYRFR